MSKHHLSATVIFPLWTFLLVSFLHFESVAFAAVVRSWSMQHRWPQQTVYYYLDDQLDGKTGELWYRKPNQQSDQWTYDQNSSLWGIPLGQVVSDGLAMLRRANPGLKFAKIEKHESGCFLQVVRIRERSETSLFGMATANGYSNGKAKRCEIQINKWCHAGIMAHEMMHILGMSHVQCRPDRDTHAIVFTGQTYLKGTADEFSVPNNLRSGRGNFLPLNGRRMLGAYDFQSIMHYSDSVMKKLLADTSLRTPKVTIGKRIHPGPLRGIEDSQPESGIHYWVENGNGRSYKAQRSQLSPIDRWALREMYYHTYRPETGPDFNGDGFADLILGDASDDAEGGANVVRVLYGGVYHSKTWGLNAENLKGAVKRFVQDRDDGNHARGLSQVLRANENPEQKGHSNRYGAAVTYGDFNGDYRMDAVIGAPGTADNAGSVHVIYGSRDNKGRDGRIGLQLAATRGDDLMDRRWVGDKGETLGSAIAAADFNGDGFSDLAIGAPNKTVQDQVESGAVYIYFGSKIGVNARSSYMLTQRDISGRFSVDAFDHFGSELAIGDFNADGYSDIAIAAPDDDFENKQIRDAGSVYIVNGCKDGLELTSSWLHQGRATIPDAPEKGDRWGSQMAVADFDADGVQDLVIASHSESVSVGGAAIDKAGVVTVIYGERQGSGVRSDNLRVLAFSQSDIGGTVKAGEGFGHALAAADFNGDGYSDLAIGSPFEDTESGINDTGLVHIINGGRNGLSLSSCSKVLPHDIGAGAKSASIQMGWSLSNGDFDGNGYVDLVIGMPSKNVSGVTAAGQIVVRYNGSPYDGPDTHIGRSFPAYVILGHAEIRNSNDPLPQKRLQPVFP